MALVGIDRDEVIKYSLEGDKENPTIFHIGVMKESDKIRIINNAVVREDDGKSNVDMFKLQHQYADILKSGLKKIENVIIKGESKDIDKIDDDALETFKMKQLMEVAGQVLKFNLLSEDEQKN